MISVYLAGEIHTPWRDGLRKESARRGLDVRFYCPVTDHPKSDAAGTSIFGDQRMKFWNDHIGAGVNAVRTRVMLKMSDVVVVHFGGQFGEWNGALDAGRALELGKPLITIHTSDLDHALKEVDRAALCTARSVEQVADVLEYAFGGN